VSERERVGNIVGVHVKRGERKNEKESYLKRGGNKEQSGRVRERER